MYYTIMTPELVHISWYIVRPELKMKLIIESLEFLFVFGFGITYIILKRAPAFKMSLENIFIW